MPLSFPHSFFDAFVRQRRHREASVRDAKATFLLAQHKSSGLDGRALALGSGER